MFLEFKEDDVLQFAASTGDRNPLHIDEDYSRTTPFGRPVVHGVLATAAALASLSPRLLMSVTDLRVVFRHPILLRVRYRIVLSEYKDNASVDVCVGKLPVLQIKCLGDAPIQHKDVSVVDPDTPALVGTVEAGPFEINPRVLDAKALALLPEEEGEYCPDLGALRSLLKRTGGAAVPNCLLGPLVWASYWTGMRTPGRESLLCELAVRLNRHSGQVKRCAGDGYNRYRVRIPVLDPRTGFATLHAEFVSSEAVVDVRVDSLLRRNAPQATLKSLDEFMRPSDTFAGRTIAVIGASRGLGRAITLALVQQGATVLAVHQNSSQRVAEMQDDVGSKRSQIRPVQCDASNGQKLAVALSDCADRLDGLVLAAAPPIVPMPFDESVVLDAVGYIGASVQLVWVPLAVCAERLTEESFVVFLSSSAVDGPPALWAHYVSAKMAVEGIGHHAAKQRPWNVLIARPPRMWTELTNSATGHIGTTPVELVASRLLQHCTGGWEASCDQSGFRQAKILSPESLGVT